MAELFIKRHRSAAGNSGTYRVLIDGVRSSSLGPGASARIPLLPGKHQVVVRTGFLRSSPVPIEWGRYTSRGYFERKANFHVQLEAVHRDAAPDLRPGPTAARTTARADPHAAMRRKSEQAATRRRFWVEPDPPEPPWP